MNYVAVKRTVKPTNPLPKYLWMKNIARKEIDLSKVNGATFFGICILQGYQRNPDETLKMIAEQAADNRELVESVIGRENMKLIL